MKPLLALDGSMVGWNVNDEAPYPEPGLLCHFSDVRGMECLNNSTAASQVHVASWPFTRWKRGAWGNFSGIHHTPLVHERDLTCHRSRGPRDTVQYLANHTRPPPSLVWQGLAGEHTGLQFRLQRFHRDGDETRQCSRISRWDSSVFHQQTKQSWSVPGGLPGNVLEVGRGTKPLKCGEM